MSSSEILMLGLYLSHEKPSEYKRRTHFKIKLANSTSILYSGHECQCSIPKTKSHGKFRIQVGEENVYSDYHSAIKIVQLIPALRRLNSEFEASLIYKVSSSTGSKETLSLKPNKKNRNSKPVTDSEALARSLIGCRWLYISWDTENLFLQMEPDKIPSYQSTAVVPKVKAKLDMQYFRCFCWSVKET